MVKQIIEYYGRNKNINIGAKVYKRGENVWMWKLQQKMLVCFPINKVVITHKDRAAAELWCIVIEDNVWQRVVPLSALIAAFFQSHVVG